VEARKTKMAARVNFSRWFADAPHALCQQKQFTSFTMPLATTQAVSVGGSNRLASMFPEVLEHV
jgi:hypothetical protein